jgi:tetratricopeptide (TPR) repeat protein
MFSRLAAERLVRKALREYERKEYARSEDLVRRALALRPGLSEAEGYLGILALKQGRLEEARERLEKTAGANGDLTVQVALGAAELLSGNPSKARSWFEKALSAFPVLFEMRYHLGLAWLREKKKRKALGEFIEMFRREDEPLFLRLERLEEKIGKK